MAGFFFAKTALFKARLSLNFVMAPCKRQVKATRHLICSSCSNWVDIVKSGCEKSWAEVQADSFSFECRGCTRMKELQVELEQLRLLVVAVVRTLKQTRVEQVILSGILPVIGRRGHRYQNCRGWQLTC